ncbi:MAG: hypothetical protein J6X37_05190 [Treponema sp.]|nr:hypothetical protein [Treponema sp.]
METSGLLQQKEFSQKDAVIAVLANDYEYVAYIELKTKDVTLYRSSKTFEALFNEIDKNLPMFERIFAFFKMLVLPEDLEVLCVQRPGIGYCLSFRVVLLTRYFSGQR